MIVSELKELLDRYPDNLELFVDVPDIKPEDCGELAIERLSMSVSGSGGNNRAVFQVESPYI